MATTSKPRTVALELSGSVRRGMLVLPSQAVGERGAQHTCWARRHSSGWTYECGGVHIARLPNFSRF